MTNNIYLADFCRAKMSLISLSEIAAKCNVSSVSTQSRTPYRNLYLTCHSIGAIGAPMHPKPQISFDTHLYRYIFISLGILID